ncbi:MAG: ABC transporter substrate-binding protein [Chloroflexota bacterium]
MKRILYFVLLASLALFVVACEQQEVEPETIEVIKEVEVTKLVEVEKEVEKEVVVTKEVIVEVPQELVTLRILYHAASPGVDEPVLSELIDQFELDNPDIDVIVDYVGREVLDQSLPLQLESGEGPDMARLLIPSGFAFREFFLDLRPYVADSAYWDENLGVPNKFFSGGTDALYGYNIDTTITGPYINRTLWEQAGVPVPSDSSDQVTWEEWAEAATQVKEAVGIPHALVMDPSGHRFAGPAISKGANYFDDEGYPALVGDEGFKDMLTLLVDWHETGVMPLDIWSGAEGQSLDAAGEFINGNSPFYMSGSWQVSRFEQEIGDAFDWEVVPNPCGDGGCTGMPGGGFMVAFAHTEHPEEVARLMDFLVSVEAYGEWAGRTLLIPQHAGLAEIGVEFQTTTENGAEALNVWLASEVSPVAQNLVSSPYGGTIFGKTKPRIVQAVAGELTIDEAIERMQQDIEDAHQ